MRTKCNFCGETISRPPSWIKSRSFCDRKCYGGTRTRDKKAFAEGSNLDALTTREKAVLSLRYERGLTLEQTGERLGVSRQRAFQLESRALAKAALDK